MTAEQSPPSQIAHYRLDSVVARGGVGVVYRATDLTLERTVAIKIIEHEDSADHVITEARMVSKLNHPGIAGVYQAGVDEASGLPFIAFEWVEGTSLRTHLRNGPLPLAEFLALGEGIAGALAHAHDAGIIHGDLKADNVVVGAHGVVKLLDFGLSTQVDTIDDGELWGTPACMAPELLAGGPRSMAADLFALGVLLFEMATGELPFGGSSGDEEQVRELQAMGPADDPRERRPDLPNAVAELIGALLALEDAARGPSAAEVERSLRLQRRGRREKSRSVALLLLLPLLALAAWWGFDRWRQETRPLAQLPGVEGSDPQPQPLRVVLGRWVDDASDSADVESERARALLTAFLHGDDPGSALLALGETGASEPAAPGAGVVRIDGRWSRVDGGWLAQWLEPGSDTACEERGSDPVTVAAAVVARWAQDPRLLLTPATTLATEERALGFFLAGIEEVRAGRFREALQRMQRARREARSFAEASAWQGVLHLLLGEEELAIEKALLLREVPSRPGRVLAATLAPPIDDRAARWGGEHPVARRVDLILASHDPRSADATLRRALAEQGSSGLVRLAELEARLALIAGEPASARAALLRFQTLGGAEWRSQRMRRWILVEEKRGDEGDEILEDWLFGVPDSEPGRFLRVPVLLARGSLARATRLIDDPFEVGGDAGPEARRSAATVLAIAGEFDRAVRLAATVRDPFDPGVAERVVAAVEWLRGDENAALVAVTRALELDERRPENRVLDRYLRGQSLLEEGEVTIAESDLGRWVDVFLALAEARQAREADDPQGALHRLSSIRWVNDELQPIQFPEIGYLAWLERILCRAEAGELDRAEIELKNFRKWWPAERPPMASVSVRALFVERVLAEIQLR